MYTSDKLLIDSFYMYTDACLYIRPLSIILHSLFAVFMFNYFHIYTTKTLNHFLFFTRISRTLFVRFLSLYAHIHFVYVHIRISPFDHSSYYSESISDNILYYIL
jgi:hypothetical protein